MLTLITIGEEIVRRRKELKWNQATLAAKVGISRATVESLENGRIGELGFMKISKLLLVLGLELILRPTSSQRPTLDELLSEDPHDQDLD